MATLTQIVNDPRWDKSSPEKQKAWMDRNGISAQDVFVAKEAANPESYRYDPNKYTDQAIQQWQQEQVESYNNSNIEDNVMTFSLILSLILFISIIAYRYLRKRKLTVCNENITNAFANINSIKFDLNDYFCWFFCIIIFHKVSFKLLYNTPVSLISILLISIMSTYSLFHVSRMYHDKLNIILASYQTKPLLIFINKTIILMLGVSILNSIMMLLIVYGFSEGISSYNYSKEYKAIAFILGLLPILFHYLMNLFTVCCIGRRPPKVSMHDIAMDSNETDKCEVNVVDGEIILGFRPLLVLGISIAGFLGGISLPLEGYEHLSSNMDIITIRLGVGISYMLITFLVASIIFYFRKNKKTNVSYIIRKLELRGNFLLPLLLIPILFKLMFRANDVNNFLISLVIDGGFCVFIILRIVNRKSVGIYAALIYSALMPVLSLFFGTGRSANLGHSLIFYLALQMAYSLNFMNIDKKTLRYDMVDSIETA